MKKLILIAVVLIVCGIGMLTALTVLRGSPAPIADPGRGEPDAVYATRGRVLMLPDPKRPTAELQIHHEPIESFVNANGTVGMGSMIMPFPVEAGGTLSGLAVGDAIEFEFAVWTTPGSRHYEARKIKKLPDGTKLAVPE